MNKTIGTCSICGGRVSVSMVWFGVVPPIPTCEVCGAAMKHPHGQVIEMEPRRIDQFDRFSNPTLKDLSSTIWFNDGWDD